MTWRRWYPLLFVVILTQGCQRDSSSDALSRARSQLGQNDYVAASDMLLAAMRLDPSSPEVFALALAFVRQAKAASHEEAHELAQDLFMRVDGLIPFQPLGRIADARQQYNDVATLFEQAHSSGPVPSDPFAAITQSIERVHDQRIPVEVRSQLLQRVRADLETLAVAAAAQEANHAEGFWQQWTDAHTQLEQAEIATLTSLYTAVHNRVAQWSQATATLREPSPPSATEEMMTKIPEVVQAGYRLRRDTVPYAEAGIPQALQDQKTLDDRLGFLERTQEWLYNQHILTGIKALKDKGADGKEQLPIEKLKRLATFDVRRLSPYVLQKYHEEWNKWFEELKEDQQKIEVTKLRIMREVTP